MIIRCTVYLITPSMKLEKIAGQVTARETNRSEVRCQQLVGGGQNFALRHFPPMSPIATISHFSISEKVGDGDGE